MWRNALTFLTLYMFYLILKVFSSPVSINFETLWSGCPSETINLTLFCIFRVTFSKVEGITRTHWVEPSIHCAEPSIHCASPVSRLTTAWNLSNFLSIHVSHNAMGSGDNHQPQRLVLTSTQVRKYLLGVCLSHPVCPFCHPVPSLFWSSVTLPPATCWTSVMFGMCSAEEL